MNYYIIIVMAIGFALSVGIIAVSFRLFKSHRGDILLYFLYYLLFHNIFGFLRMISDHLADDIVQLTSNPRLQTLDIHFTTFIFPLVPLSLYMLIKFTRKLLQLDLPSRFGYLYVAVWSILFVLLVLGGQNILDNRSFSLLNVVNIITNILAIVIIYGFLFSLYLKAKTLPEYDKNHANNIAFTGSDSVDKAGVVRLLSIILLTGYTLYFIVSVVTRHMSFIHRTMPLLFMAINLPPLFILKRHIHLFAAVVSPSPTAPPDLNQIFSQYKITPREQEIVHLLIQGKSNKEIEDQIFVSVKTVKNHVYNIYKKFNVKNRTSLLNLIHSLKN